MGGLATATAQCQCQLSVFKVEQALATLKKDRRTWQVSSAYAEVFHQRVCGAKPPKEWPSDLGVPQTEFGDIVMAMDKEIRTTISLHGIRKMKSLPIVKQNSLWDEVMSGKSDLSVNKKGEPERVVRVVVLQLQRDDGDIFVQLGKEGDEEQGQRHIVPACALPAMKLNTEDTIDEHVAYRKLLTKLRPLAGSSQLKRIEVANEDGPSNRFSVHTRYQRMICHADLIWPIEGETCSVDRVANSSALHGHWLAKNIVWSSDGPVDMHRDVYAFCHDGRTSVYTWLSESEFEDLKQKEKQQFIRHWISNLQPDPRTQALRTAGMVVSRQDTLDGESEVSATDEVPVWHSAASSERAGLAARPKVKKKVAI